MRRRPAGRAARGAVHQDPAGGPVDNEGRKVDLTMAFFGTRGVFERAGFTKVADTHAIAGGFPRVLMRRHLT